MTPFSLKYVPFPEDLHGKIPGFTVVKGNDYFILIDSNMPESEQTHILKHELAHIVLNHQELTKPVEEINTFGDDMFGPGWLTREAEADAYADAMTDQEFQTLLSYQIK